jgi:hypothetical protein
MIGAVITALESSLASIATVGPGFIDAVNDFPSVAILRPSVQRAHIGAAATLDSFSFLIRGYVYSGDDSLVAAEILARDIELCVQSFNYQLVYDSRVLSVETDEGLLSPYGMCDILCEIRWIRE